jgi:hypothetical protein
MSVLELLMLNKFLIPAVLVATVVIAGIFAFMPVEKASTVHGTIDANVDSELDALDRTIFLSMNMSRDGTKGIFTVIPAKAGKTISGSYILSVTPNNHTSSYSSGAGHGFGSPTFSCGLVDGQGNILSATNASKGVSANGTLAPTTGRAVSVQYDRTNSNVGGVCNVYLFLDRNAGE